MNMTYKGIILFTLCVTLYTLPVGAQGLPLIHNFPAAEYGGHNRNYDIEVDDDGTIYVANFEGLLYYDRAQWRIIHSPGINRVTVVYRASDKRVWIGGYNFFARLDKRANGELYMKELGKAGTFSGEVMEIFESNGSLQFIASDNNIYEVRDDRVMLKRHTNAQLQSSLSSDVVDLDALENGEQNVVLDDITQTEQLDAGLQVMVKKNNGLIVSDNKGRQLYTITESNGLCSNQVSYVVYDGHGLLWGATAHGIFAIELPSIYTWLLPKDGLSGVVHAIIEYEGTTYICGFNGLFRLKGHTVERVGNINTICWSAAKDDHGVLVATATGIYRIDRSGAVHRLTSNSTTALLVDGSKLYAAESDGVYLIEEGTASKKICPLEKTMKILKDRESTIWLQSVFGEIYLRKSGEDAFHPYPDNRRATNSTLVDVGGTIIVMGVKDTSPFPYPAFSMTDHTGITWLTDNDGKHLYPWKDGSRVQDETYLFNPLGNMVVEAMFYQNGKVWIGGDDMLAVVDVDRRALTTLTSKSRLFFRSIVMGNDSVLWGGYGDMPDHLPMLDSNEGHLRFVYSLDYAPLTGKTLYRYRLNDNKWSAWSEKQYVEFLNLPYGSFTLSVQAQLANGKLSRVASIGFSIAYPLYMRWYMVVLYFILIAWLVYTFFRYRLKKLQRDKIKLEHIVQERTADLRNAQHELIRQEKMASVGKLTEGLIDRILNPMNYIINFSKMSIGLLNDLKDNIENNTTKGPDGQVIMDEDNYEDTADIIDMLSGNLKSVDQYGQNTTRILKAMEEMLKDRTGGYVDMDLLTVLQQDEAMLNNFFAKELQQYGIRTHFTIPTNTMPMRGNPDMLSKTIMSILGNAVYAVVRKFQKLPVAEVGVAPEISLTATAGDSHYTITIHDNGIGIEEKIVNKIFDPFFTTKTTGEAAGVGLYLSREIIQNHSGDISVVSVKDEYTEFIVTLPALKAKKDN